MGSNLFLTVENGMFTATMAFYLLSMAFYFIFFALKNEKAGKAAGYLIGVGFVLHTAALICRGIGAGRLPLTNQYEFATSFAWGIALCFLFFLWKYHFQALGVFVAPIIFLVIGYAAMQSREVRELMPALQSGWLGIHVATAIISYGAFGVACAISVMFLLRDKMTGNAFWQEHIPEAEKLDIISYRAVSFGFLFLTFVIVTGAIWAESAWGSYWSWDPKETWALITWFIYAVYLHLRLNRGWRGKSAAVFAVVGFVCVLFTYIGVNTLIPSIHSYA